MARNDDEVSVEYEVLVGVKIDADTGEVTHVIAHTEEFNHTAPTRIYMGGSKVYEAGDVPEYLPEDHPLYEHFVKIADGVVTDEVEMRFRIAGEVPR